MAMSKVYTRKIWLVMNQEILLEALSLGSPMEEGVSQFVGAIKSTKEYKEFECQKQKMKMFPELKAKVDEYRHRNYELQTQEESENLMEKLEQFQEEYEGLWENPLVEDFMGAELAFCRMMQNINVIITEALDFE